MNTLQTHITNYLDFCQLQKRLDEKTQKAYRIDLFQFLDFYPNRSDVNAISHNDLEKYIATLHTKYKPKTVKRKLASLKAFFHYLEYKEIIEYNPFNKP